MNSQSPSLLLLFSSHLSTSPPPAWINMSKSSSEKVRGTKRPTRRKEIPASKFTFRDCRDFLGAFVTPQEESPVTSNFSSFTKYPPLCDASIQSSVTTQE